jgi:hypothetical protein
VKPPENFNQFYYSNTSFFRCRWNTKQCDWYALGNLLLYHSILHRSFNTGNNAQLSGKNQHFHVFLHYLSSTHTWPSHHLPCFNIVRDHDLIWCNSGMKIVCQVRRDPVEDAYKKRLDSVRQYMISKSIPSELHERVVLYCQFQHRKNQQNAVSQRCSFYVLLCMCERMHSDLTFICAYIMKQHAITTLFEPPSRQCQL